VPKVTVYRYDNEDYDGGRIIFGRGDSFETLTPEQKTVELAIRSTLPNGKAIRSTSLYTWANETVAKRLWPLSKKKYLYELEVESEDMRHKADLNYYSEAIDAVKTDRSLQEAVNRYCSGEESVPPATFPRSRGAIAHLIRLERLASAASCLSVHRLQSLWRKRSKQTEAE
jgi:hypothetical protein